jgi:hypothetical protein
LDAGRGEDGVERGGELDIPIADQEPQPVGVLVEVHQQIPDRLRDALTGRMRGDPGQVRPTPVQLHDEQHIQPGQPHRLHGEEVTRQHAAASVCRNSVQLEPLRRGAGPSRCRRRIRRTEVADTRTPSLRHSPTILMYPHRGFSRAIRTTISTVSGSRPRLPCPVAG